MEENRARVLDPNYSASSEAGMPNRAASSDVTGLLWKNSSNEAPPFTQEPRSQVSMNAEPSGRSTTRETTPLSTTEGPKATFNEFDLGAIDQSSNKKILQVTIDGNNLSAAVRRNDLV